MAGLVALVVFTLVLVTVTLVVVRARAREAAAKTRPPAEVEQYRRLPLVPEGGLVCCDTQASSTKSCSCQRTIQGLSLKTFGHDCPRSGLFNF